MIRNNWMPIKNAWMNQYDMMNHNVFSVPNNSEKHNHNELVNQAEIRNPNLVMNNYEKANPNLMMNYKDKGNPNEQSNNNQLMNNSNEIVKEKMNRKEMMNRISKLISSKLNKTFDTLENCPDFETYYEILESRMKNGKIFIGAVQQNQHIEGYGIFCDTLHQNHSLGQHEKNQKFQGLTTVQAKFQNKAVKYAFKGSMHFNDLKKQLISQGELFQIPSHSNNKSNSDRIFKGTMQDLYLSGTGQFNFKNEKYAGVFQQGWITKGTIQKYENGDKISVIIEANSQGSIIKQSLSKSTKIYQYLGQIKMSRPHGNGILKEKNSQYKGNFLNGMKNGKGKIVYQNGNVMEGIWLNDKLQSGYAKSNLLGGHYEGYIERSLPHGKGKLKKCTQTYEGQFKNGKKQGKGVINYQNGDKIEGVWQGNILSKGYSKSFHYNRIGMYSGELRQDLPHGQGKLTTPSYTYQGSFFKGKRSGYGEAQYKNGCIFKGQWSQDNQLKGQGVALSKTYRGGLYKSKPHGKGTLKLSNCSYEGNFANGKKEGQGKFTRNNGDYLTGQWKGDQFFKGQGRVSSSNGLYIGQLSKNLKSGKGKMTLKNGNILQGTWHLDLLQGQGKILYNNGQEYHGNFLKGQKSGWGILYILNRNHEKKVQYQGNFKDDQYHGDGIYYYQNQNSYYEGQFQNGAKSGQGTYQSDQIKYKGQWKKDMYNGYGVLVKKTENITLVGQFKNGKQNGTIDIMRTRDGKTLFSGCFKNGQKNGQGTQMIQNYTIKGQWKNGKKNGIFIKKQFLNGEIVVDKFMYEMGQLLKK